MRAVDVNDALGRLPEEVRAHVLRARGGQLDAVRDALRSVDWPSFRSPIPAADALTTPQRALAELLTTMPGSPVHAYAIPSFSWNLRRWLGLDPPGALETRIDGEPRWRLLQTNGVRAALDAAPLGERLLLLAELGFGAYRLELPRDLENDLDFYQRIDGSAGDAATIAAEFCLRIWEEPDVQSRRLELPESTRLAITLAAVRAGVPLREPWQRLLPFVGGTRWPLTHECIRALPCELRASAVALSAARVHPASAEALLLALLPEVPEAPEVAALQRPSDADGDPRQLDAVRRLAGLPEHADLLRRIVDSGMYSVDVTRIALDALPAGSVAPAPLLDIVADPQELDALRIAAARHLAATGDHRDVLRELLESPSAAVRIAVAALLDVHRA